MGRVEGKVAFITGAARGQGRNHALRLAEEGADIIAVDLCEQIDSAPYPLGTAADLADTAKQVEALGRRIATYQADVRDDVALADTVAQGVREIGPIDIVIPNAGVALFNVDEPHCAWQDTIDINLTGVFNTLQATVPGMVERGAGGAIVLISSTAGLRGILGTSRAALGYVASKHALVGLMRSYANALAAHSIRVNTINPTGVETPMITAESMAAFLEQNPHLVPHITNAMPVELLDVQDISNAVLYLCSDDGRYVTGTTLTVDAGFVNKV